MADIANLPVADAGTLLSSFPAAQAGIAQTQAQTDLIGQQTLGAQIQNEQQKIRLKIMQDAVSDYSGQTGPPTGGQDNAGGTGSDASGDPVVNPGALGNQLRSSLFVNKAGTAQEQAQIAKAARLAPIMGAEYLNAALKMRDTAVAAREGQAQNTAGKLFEEAVQVNTASDPLATLQNINPGAYAHIMSVSGGDEDKARALAGEFSKNLGNLVHPYTGREVEYVNGQPRDKQTTWALPGGAQAQLSTKDLSDLATKGMELQDVKMSDNSVRQRPAYSAQGAQNLEQWMVAHGADKNDPRLGNIANAARSGSAGAIGAAAQENAKQDNITRLASGDPTMRKALEDKDFDSPVAPQNAKSPTAYASMSEAQKAQVQTYQSNLKDLQEGSQNLSKASASAMSNFKAAAYLIDHFNGAITPAGVPGEIAGIIGKLGWSNQTADARWEIIKQLTNGAVGQLKETYGSRPAMFDVKVNLERAFPSLEEMDLPAARALVAQQIDIAKYGQDTSQHAVKFIRAGKDPGDFAEWNQKYFPREDAVNKSLTNGVNMKGAPAPAAAKPAAPAPPKAGAIVNGWKFNGGDPSMRSNWSKQ